MFDRKLCLATLFVASMLVTAQGKNFDEHTDNEHHTHESITHNNV